MKTESEKCGYVEQYLRIKDKDVARAIKRESIVLERAERCDGRTAFDNIHYPYPVCRSQLSSDEPLDV